MTRRGAILALIVLAGAPLLACGPPAEPCGFFGVTDLPPTDSPEAAIGLTLYQLGRFPDGTEPELEERTSDRAVYRLTVDGDTVGWITATRDDMGWVAPQGTTCAQRPSDDEPAPPSSSTTTSVPTTR